LFLAGVAACQFIVLPKAIAALLWFNQWLNIDPDLRLNEWLSFAIIFPVAFGLSFQTPLVMLFLERMGILDVDVYRRKRRIAWFVLFIAAALGPSIDVFSLMFQGIALCLLYELGILLCIWSPTGRRDLDVDVPEPEEMVEV
jgi:sec-independent protein translocase protein TatC